MEGDENVDTRQQQLQGPSSPLKTTSRRQQSQQQQQQQQSWPKQQPGLAREATGPGLSSWPLPSSSPSLHDDDDDDLLLMAN